MRRFALLIGLSFALLLPGLSLAQATAGSYSVTVQALESIGTGATGITASAQHNFSYAAGYGSGTGDSQINRVYTANLSLSASATSTIDVYNGLTDQDGTAIVFAEVVCIAAKNTGTIEIEISPATNGWLGVLKATDDVLRLLPGAVFMFCRDAGSTVTDTTAQNLKFTNTSGATTATAVYTILGRAS